MGLAELAIVTSITTVITLTFNIIFHSIKNSLDWSVDKKRFKRTYAFEQLNGLYFDLYKRIIQSEYIRYFYKEYHLETMDFMDSPFIEIERTRRKEKVSINREKGVTKSESIEVVEDSITAEKKIYIAEKIIENPQFASKELLKIAIAYRFAHSKYDKKFVDQEMSEYFKKEEVRLLYLMITTIIKEFNELLDSCHLNIDGKEVSSGLFNSNIFYENRD
ncbi:hypothetical protein ACQKEY_12855 [Lysinibacillus fusiformis]|uniref:hypothetical protein n=1 Tax=Lysinibacillus fusiformis TaxID=28031 RepID=UPI003D02525B